MNVGCSNAASPNACAPHRRPFPNSCNTACRTRVANALSVGTVILSEQVVEQLVVLSAFVRLALVGVVAEEILRLG